MRDIKDRILAMERSNAPYERLQKEANKLVEEDIGKHQDYYEADWLLNLLDAVMLDKALTGMGYDVAHNVDWKGLKEAAKAA